MALATFATDTFASGGRGSPNAISPGSDGGNWSLVTGDQTPSFASNQGVFTYNASTNLGVWVYASSILQTDQEVLVNVTQGNANGDIAGAVVRCTDANHYYYADLGNSSGNIEIGKKVGATFTSLTTAPVSTSFGTKYSLRFQVIGSTLKAKVWDAATSEPTAWSVQCTDTTLYSGNFGICMAPLGSHTCKFDTFSATNGGTPPANPPDPTYAAEQPGLVAGATNADLVPSQDISAYKVWSLQIDTIATGATLTFQGSNDGTNFVAIKADENAATTTTATGLFSAKKRYRYLRVRQTAWSSGLTTGTLELYTDAA